MDRPWKVFERKVARELGTTRRLRKGTDDKADIGDDNYPLCVDAKQGKNISPRARYMELKHFAQSITIPIESDIRPKEPVLVYRRPGKHRVYVFVGADYLCKILYQIGQVDSFRWYDLRKVKRWNFEIWFEQAIQIAQDKIPGVRFVDDKTENWMAIIELHIFASALKAAGIIKAEDTI